MRSNTKRLKTLREFLRERGILPNLSSVILNAAEACKYIRAALNNPNRFSLTETYNVYGDQVSYLDLKSDEIMLAYMTKCRQVREYASEDRPKSVHLFHRDRAQYCVASDPLDGSSLVTVNLAVGSIVGVYDGDFFKRPIIGAVYVIYGPLTTLVYAVKGRGAHEFVLDERSKQFVLSRENLRLNTSGSIYGTSSYDPIDDARHHEFISKLAHSKYKTRYSGCFVADANHILMKQGGIFCYPSTVSQYPTGKLRKFFECDPISLIFEEANGLSSNGRIRMLKKKTATLTDTSPIYIGSKGEVKLAESILGGKY